MSLLHNLLLLQLSYCFVISGMILFLFLLDVLAICEDFFLKAEAPSVKSRMHYTAERTSF